jgi:hypothetical protein
MGGPGCAATQIQADTTKITYDSSRVDDDPSRISHR